MSILSQLNQLNITSDQLIGLTANGIIRIEKKLKAEVQFNDNLTINDVESIIDLLNGNKTELEFLFTDHFSYFRQLIDTPNKLITFEISKSFDNSTVTENFVDFISTYFEKDIELYVINCLKDKHYSALSSLLLYKAVLDEQTIDYITESLRKKLNFSFETLSLKPRGPFNTIDYLTNPYFYRCLSQLGGYNFEKNVVDIVNTSSNNSNQNNFYLQVLFSLGEYKSSRSDLSQVIKDNKDFAIERGVRNKHYGKNEYPKRGGTIIQKKSFSSNTSSSSSGSGKSAIGIVIAILIIAVKIGFYVSRSNRNTYRDNQNITQRYNSNDSYQMLSDNYKFKKNSNSNTSNVPVIKYLTYSNKSKVVHSKFTTIYDSILYFQGNNFKLINEKDATFNIDETYFKNDYYPSNFRAQVVIENKSEKDVIVLAKTKVGNIIRFIPSMKRGVISQNLKGISIYSGTTPQLITVKTNAGAIINGFRFKEWSEIDVDIFNRFTWIDQYEDYELDLTITNEQLKLIKGKKGHLN